MTAQSYLAIVRARFTALRKEENRIRAAASLIADSVLSGGTLWIHDREEALSWEANVKAAGLFLTNNRWTAESVLKAGDIFLIGAVESDFPADLALAAKAREAGAKVIALVSKNSGKRPTRGGLLADASDIALDNRSPDAMGELSEKGIPSPFCPAAGVMNDCLFWALSAALSDELLSRGKPPTVYRGVHLRGGREYNALAALRFKELGY